MSHNFSTEQSADEDEEYEEEKACEECEGLGYVCAALPNNRIGTPEMCPVCYPGKQ
jgi:hypothetical protein